MFRFQMENTYNLKNDVGGYQLFEKSLVDNDHCVMEATGSYHLGLATWLVGRNHFVSVINALVIKRFVQMRLKLAKTDKADAKMIRLYAELEKPTLWSPPAEYIQQASEINGLVEMLIRQRTALKNKLHSVSIRPGNFAMVLMPLRKQITVLNKQIKELEKSMEVLITQHQGKLLSQLQSIPGIGTKTAMFLIVITDGFTAFESSKQLSAFFGLAPTIRLSGKSVRGQSRISKAGNNVIRNLLFMCSFSACKNNKGCKDLFDRIVAKGKSKKLALIAVANKLLKQSLAIAKSGMVYDENYRSAQPCI
ncbi:IS110 family transposase [Chryseosolibacter indicus]|uniref:IS110 family transposase n=1 Tax=Chryseosolibacter indicus TaxID=2782351 RepID=A0ABS5VYW2_9BACT|nr:IS110 family transposase [Chryseosolibacter indicus]MBT1706421.1 IS110 family transposase [Chryseosolibacter indicus]